MLRCDTYGYEVAFKLHPLQKSTEDSVYQRIIAFKRKLNASLALERKVGSKRKTFHRVEYDKNYTGGGYSGFGKFVLIPCGQVSIELAFEKKTKLDRCHIVDYSVDEIYDKNGDPIGG